MNPCEHWRYFHRLNQNENGPSATRCSFHVKPPQHKRIAHDGCSVWPEEPSGLLLASTPMDDALRTTHAVHSGADSATLRTGGIPSSASLGSEPVFSPGEEADMLAIARAQLTTYALASLLSEDDEQEQASAGSLPVSRETGPQPRKCSPCRPRQSGGARCRYRIHRACPTHGTWFVPTEADASTTSSAAGGLPSHRARRTHREVSSGHTAATSGWSSPATAHDVPGSGEGEAIARLIQQLRATASVLGYVCRVLWNLPARRFTIGFT